MTLLEDGRRVTVADDRRLTLYELVVEGTVMVARPIREHELPGIATAIAASSLGLVVAIQKDGGGAVVLIGDDDPVLVHECPHSIAELAATGADVYLVEAGPNPTLVRVGLRRRAVVRRTLLDHIDVRLEPRGDRGILVTDRRARTIRAMSADLEEDEGSLWQRAIDRDPQTPCLSGSLSKGRKTDPCADPPQHPYGCGCHRGQEPTGCPGERTPGGESPCAPADEPSGRDPGTGDVAVSTPEGGTVVGTGDRVEHYPPKGSGHGPCGRSLFYTVDTLRRVGAYYLAADAGARTMSLLSQDMNLLDEWSAGRRGARVLTTTGSTTMLTLRHGDGQWQWTDLHAVTTRLRPDLERFVTEPLESKTFYGQQTHVLSYGQPTTPTKIKAVILPVVEGNQTYSSPNLAGFTAYVQRVVAPQVHDYYDENSFGQLTDVTVDVFGGNIGPSGGPLKLPRGRVADYYFPTYDPARVELTRNGLTGTETITVDGRESLVLNAQPLTGGGAGKTLSVPFFALGLRRDIDLYPAQVKFLGTEKLALDVTLPDGTAKTLTLIFTARTFNANDDTQVNAMQSDLAAYLGGVMTAAETAAGILSPVFASPKVQRVPAVGVQFGALVVTFAGTATAGNKLSVRASSATVPGGDPLGLDTALLGVIPVTNTWELQRYLDVATLLAQESAGAGYNARLLEPPTASMSGDTLTTAVTISKRFGGPGATVTLTSSTSLASLFTASKNVANSATTDNSATALRDRSDFYQDTFSAAIQRVRAAGLPTNLFKDYTCILLLPVEPAVPNPADPNAVLPSEAWNVTPLERPFDFRGAENVTTVADRVDPKVQAQSAWALIFMPGGLPDTPMIVHEIGHALGFGDLYFQNGYRDELNYLGDWAMMDSHWRMPHHCGYHKLQARWIPEGAGTEKDYGRVFPLGLPDPDQVRTWEFLLVPVELWRDTLVGSARATFGVGPDTPVVQLAWIDLGGDGATFGLIEARQMGARFSQHLPAPGAGVLVTNGIAWTLDDRFATNGWYRRQVQWLNPLNVLRNAGDSFDLARAPELAVKGMTVDLVDTKLVEGDARVYRVKVRRQNAEFVDLYFENAPVYYKNPDLWVDWQGNNQPATDLNPGFGLGQPTDQGEAIRVPSKGTEPHWVIGRVRNRGQVKATDVKLNFFYFEPPGGGDGQKPMDVNNLSAYHLIGSTTHPQVPGGNAPELVLQQWDVPAGFSGHTCVLVQIEDYRIPEDATGAVLASDDVWVANNHAQKNVDKFEALKSSPFTPVEFDFTVRNEGVGPEVAYLEPDGLPLGMTLTVTPPVQSIAAASTVRFHCRLELDDAVIEAGCENDQRFRIHAWRQDPESSARWGGVEYEIRPRQRTQVTLTGSWDYQNHVALAGSVTPDPGGGTVRVRVEFAGHQATWITTSVQPGGGYSWTGPAPSDSFSVDAVSWFEGNRTFGSARSAPAHTEHPPIVR